MTRFNMKWVQTIMEVDWGFFNENYQIVNHIQNILVWATKNGLLQTIKEYETKDKNFTQQLSNGGVMALPSANTTKIHSSNFLPLTFRLDITKDEFSYEELQFLNCRNEGKIYIFPSQGLGKKKYM